MTEQTQPDGGRGATGQGPGSDPWAPPQPPQATQPPQAPQAPQQSQPLQPPPGPSLQKDAPPPAAQQPSVHDQATMAAMPAVGFGPHAGPTVPPQSGQPTGPAVPPPPIAPNGPGVPPYAPTGAPAPPAGYGYPSYPSQQGHSPYPGQQGPSPYPGPQGPSPYPQPPAYGWPGAPMGPVPQNSAGTAALVLGILSIVLFCFYGVLSIIMGIVAVVLGFQGRKRADRGEATNRSQAQAGIVCGVIGIVVGLIALAFVILMYFLAVGADRPDRSPDTYPGDSSYNSAPYAPAPYDSAPRLPVSPRL
ncbi:DUF4190 domain-containing protein [Streptomyces sp. NPDC090119]|uniref:DUF4190 domain-containing protein n=1 Tax=Streptomyces sp. NPDC090119 TaxID=3365951 RepID=UPI00381D418D